MSNKHNLIKEARKKLWNQGVLEWKLDPTQKDIYEFIKSSKKKTTVVNCSRRLGKCLPEGTEVMTPTGPKVIENLSPGDAIYGFNSDGSVSLTTVIAHEYMGEKKVFELNKNGRTLAESTKDHRWAVNNPVTKFKIVEKNITEFKSTDRIHRRIVKVPGGNVYNPQAYSIGFLLGEGCSRQGVKQIHASSAFEEPIKAVAGELNAKFWRQGTDSHTWVLAVNPKGREVTSKYAESVMGNYYNEWCKNRYAHEKIVDIEILRTWDRTSLLRFLAGLIDSDGSVGVNNSSLVIQFASQSKSIIDAFVYTYYTLFQYKPTVIQDKYKNNPLYQISIKNNMFNIAALKELDTYLTVPHKKWKKEYENLKVRAESADYCRVKIGKSRIAKTYDIQVDNDTNLYLLANGLVTHNSYLLTIIAIEQCLQHPKSIVKFLQPEQKMVRVNIRPIMDTIFKDAPPNVKPKFKTQDNIYEFLNGSEIQLAGTDNGNHEKLRGGDAHLCLVDEAAFVKSELEYIVKSILIPTTSITRGKIVLSSTSPKEPDHDFKNYMEQAILDNTFIKKTIYDAVEDEGNERITQEIVSEIISEYRGGEKNEHFRREYMCEIVSSGDNAVIPEFEEVKEDIIGVWPRPTFFDSYVSMDIGFRDLTVALYAFLDFKNSVVVIEDETVMNGPQMTTGALASEILKTEARLWIDKVTGEMNEPYLRIADNNLILINDLQRDFGLTFLPTQKDNKEAAINNARMMLLERRVIINPRCKTLISHLQNATWDKSRKSFNRSPDDGHYDAIDALVYLLRNIDLNRNPYPNGFVGLSGAYHANAGALDQRSSAAESFEGLFQIKSSLKSRKN